MKNVLIIIFVGFLSISGIHAQNVAVQAIGGLDSTKLFVGLKDSLKPDVYVDGTKYDFKIIDLLDPEKIESINVLKGEAAVKEYNSPNGVLLISTKKAGNDKEGDVTRLRIKGANEEADGNTKIRIRGKSSFDNSSPMIIIDGKVATKEQLSKLSTSDIESIDVLKNEKSLEKYKASNGVIVVKTYKSKNHK